MANRAPTFHNDGSITYFDPSKGWKYRVHPSFVPSYIIRLWPNEYYSKWEKAMYNRGFIHTNLGWRPAHPPRTV